MHSLPPFVLGLDHVALWVSDRDRLSTFLCRHLGVHEIQCTSRFTLLGADARYGKLTLFGAERPPERGILDYVAFRVRDLDAAVARLPDDVAVERRRREMVLFEALEGLRIALIQRAELLVEYDLDHVELRVPDASRTAANLMELGLNDNHVRLVASGRSQLPERAGHTPLLNHLGVRVESVRESLARLRRTADEVEMVEGPNTLAAFIDGPNGVRLEYIEHKLTFSLT